MGFALLWVVLCLIPAAVARGKGRGGLSMFLVSLVLLVALVLAVGVALWVGVGFFDSPKPAPARVSAVAQVGAGVADRKARWPAEGPAVLRKAEERLGAGDADGAVAF